MKEFYRVVLTVADHDMCRLPRQFTTWDFADKYGRYEMQRYAASGYRIELCESYSHLAFLREPASGGTHRPASAPHCAILEK